ncbi:hypothetical protein BDN70DRAFT_685322 [Pholiota conissans]|uniref:Uncharacterized protein n=1 Tax=Pholiota conissans TaxID=109636 RepID=A0A9P5Z501_9AGAR|nr:hypothetical protein BDN70DRAFT_685322 [Pholiota conissans]
MNDAPNLDQVIYIHKDPAFPYMSTSSRNKHHLKFGPVDQVPLSNGIAYTLIIHTFQLERKQNWFSLEVLNISTPNGIPHIALGTMQEGMRCGASQCVASSHDRGCFVASYHMCIKCTSKASTFDTLSNMFSLTMVCEPKSTVKREVQPMRLTCVQVRTLRQSLETSSISGVNKRKSLLFHKTHNALWRRAQEKPPSSHAHLFQVRQNIHTRATE